MPINAMIPLLVQPTQGVGPDLGKAYSDAQRAWQIEGSKQQLGQINALKQIFSDPGAIGPDGMPTAQALQKTMAAAPELGLEMQRNMLYNQQRALQSRVAETKLFDAKRSMVTDAEWQGRVAYQDALGRGLPEPEARKAGLAAQNEALQPLLQGGILGPGEQALVPKDFDPNRGLAALTPAQQEEAGFKQQELDIRKTGQGLELQRLTRGAEGEPKPWVTPDGKVVSAVWNRDTKQAVNIDTNQPLPAGSVATTASEAQTLAPPPGDVTKSGEDYLATLPDGAHGGLANQIRAVAEGREPFPVGYGQARMQNFIRALNQYDPNFDAINYNSRFKTKQDFAPGGKSGQNVTRLNTAIAHAETLAEDFKNLDNSSLRIWNQLGNLSATQLGTERAERLNKVKADVQALSGELSAVFRGTGQSTTEIHEWEKTIDTASSPSAMKGAIEGALDLLMGRVSALGDAYNRGMSSTQNPLSLLSKQSLDRLKKLGIDVPDEVLPEGSKQSDTPAAMPGIKGNEKDKYDALPSGAGFNPLGNDGKLLTGPDGKPIVLYKP